MAMNPRGRINQTQQHQFESSELRPVTHFLSAALGGCAVSLETLPNTGQKYKTLFNKAGSQKDDVTGVLGCCWLCSAAGVVGFTLVLHFYC